MRVALFVVLLTSLVGCTTYRDQLSRGQRSFELSEHDRTLAILRDLEPDRRHLTFPEQAEYAYLRGMTDYRVGYKADARYWLSLAKAYEDNSPGVLPADWKLRVNEALDELNGVVYAGGVGALTTSRTEEVSKPDTPTKEKAKDAPTPNNKKEAPQPESPATGPSS